MNLGHRDSTPWNRLENPDNRATSPGIQPVKLRILHSTVGSRRKNLKIHATNLRIHPANPRICARIPAFFNVQTGSPLFSMESELRPPEFAGDEVAQGAELRGGVVAAGLAFGRAEPAV